MILEEDWGICPERIRQFFLTQPDVAERPDGFQYGDCHIRLTPTEKLLLDKWPQTRTIIHMEGPENDTQQIYQRFFLQFLSAGG